MKHKKRELEFFEHDQDYDLFHKSPLPDGILTERGYSRFIEKTNKPTNQNKQIQVPRGVMPYI